MAQVAIKSVGIRYLVGFMFVRRLGRSERFEQTFL
jgi:hypothetical protein